MSDVANRFVVIVDANVLYPFTIRDVVLRFAEAGLFRVRWTDRIIDEWIDSLTAQKPDLRESLESQIRAMKQAFPESWVEGYEDLIEGLSLPDPDDRHVLSAAICSGAQLILTENLKDFPSEELGKYNIEAITADDFLTGTFELYRRQAMAALNKMRRAYSYPQYNKDEFILLLTSCGLVTLATLVKEDIDRL